MTDPACAVFLAGIPRSGTSWAARALHAALGGELCFEPCNWKAHPEMARWHLRYLPASGPDEGFAALVDGVAEHRYSVVKEVHTYLAVEQWARRCERVVIVERDPLDLAASWHRLGYDVRFRVDLMLDQPALLDDHLGPFETHLRASTGWPGDLGRYWGASYLVLRRIAATHPDWRWARHGDLCADPATRFRSLLAGVGRPVDERALDTFLAEHDRAPEAGASPYDEHRARATEADKWRSVLTPDEADAVIAGARPFLEAGLAPSG